MNNDLERLLQLFSVLTGVGNLLLALMNLFFSFAWLLFCVGVVLVPLALWQLYASVEQLRGRWSTNVTVGTAMGMLVSIGTFNLLGLLGCVVVFALTLAIHMVAILPPVAPPESAK